MKKLLIILLVALALPALAVTLSWDVSPDPEVYGYNVYYGGASRSYTNITSSGPLTTFTVSGLAEGVTYYFAVTAYIPDGLESDPSNEISYTVPCSYTNTVRVIFPGPGPTQFTTNAPVGPWSTTNLTGSLSVTNMSARAKFRGDGLMVSNYSYTCTGILPPVPRPTNIVFRVTGHNLYSSFNLKTWFLEISPWQATNPPPVQFFTGDVRPSITNWFQF